MKKIESSNMTAIFSSSGQYRYELRGSTSRILQKEDRPICYVGANPSKAGSKVDGKVITDQTARRFLGFAERFKATHYIAVNLYPDIETNPNNLKGIEYNILNTRYIRTAFDEVVRAGGKVIFCWGDCLKFKHNRNLEVIDLAKARGIQPYCFGVTKKGNPGHPLRLAGNTRLKKFKI